eukprot:scaffold151308_cov20-Prasinocladus_malaysianus.AAC.1
MVKDQWGMWVPTCAGKAAGCAMAGPPWIAASAQSHLGCTPRTAALPVGTKAKPANTPPIDQLRAATSSMHRQYNAGLATDENIIFEECLKLSMALNIHAFIVLLKTMVQTVL